MTVKPSAPRSLDILRSHLANERTLLAYYRTTLALLIVAGSVVKFFEPGLIHIAGYGFGVLSAVTFVWGTLSYRRTKIAIDYRAPGSESAD